MSLPRIETFGDALVAAAWIPVIVLALAIAYYLRQAWRVR